MSEITAALTEARTQAAVLLVDTCTITTDADRDDDATIDPDTLALTDPADGSTFWSGPCLVEPLTILGDVPVAPETFESAPRYRVSLPYDAPPPPAGALLTITASQDPQLVNASLRIDAAHFNSLGLFRMLLAETRPALITGP